MYQGAASALTHRFIHWQRSCPPPPTLQEDHMAHRRDQYRAADRTVADQGSRGKKSKNTNL